MRVLSCSLAFVFATACGGVSGPLPSDGGLAGPPRDAIVHPPGDGVVSPVDAAHLDGPTVHDAPPLFDAMTPVR